MLTGLKKRIYEILEVSTVGDEISRYFDIFIITLIILNVVAVILESVHSLAVEYFTFFYWFDIISVIIFSIEYLLRMWTCTANPSFQNPLSGRIRFAFTPFALIDLLAILPFFLPMFIPLDLRFIRVLRLMRIFRVLKMARYSNAIKLLGAVMKKEKAIISIIFFVLVLILVIASSLMYYAEKDVQPEIFSSIPAAMWWAIVTLTTVGYGDVYPVTLGGKFLGTLIALLGIGFFALPAGVLASGFMEEVNNEKCENKELDVTEKKSKNECSRLLESLTELKEQDIISGDEFYQFVLRIEDNDKKLRRD